MSALIQSLRRIASTYRRAVASLVLLATAVALWIGGAQPFAVGLVPAPWDKVVHAALFALVAAVCGIASGRRGWRMAMFAIVGALTLGAVDEWHQSGLPGRNAGFDDLAADVAGGLMGTLWLLSRTRVA